MFLFFPAQKSKPTKIKASKRKIKVVENFYGKDFRNLKRGDISYNTIEEMQSNKFAF